MWVLFIRFHPHQLTGQFPHSQVFLPCSTKGINSNTCSQPLDRYFCLVSRAGVSRCYKTKTETISDLWATESCHKTQLFLGSHKSSHRTSRACFTWSFTYKHLGLSFYNFFVWYVLFFFLILHQPSKKGKTILSLKGLWKQMRTRLGPWRQLASYGFTWYILPFQAITGTVLPKASALYNWGDRNFARLLPWWHSTSNAHSSLILDQIWLELQIAPTDTWLLNVMAACSRHSSGGRELREHTFHGKH